MRGVEQIPWLYDAFFWLYEKLGFQKWRLQLVSGARGRVLEVGCGSGRNLPLYSQSVVALEPSADAIAAAKRRSPRALLVRGSAEALPFRDGAFDTVVSSLVFCSVPNPSLGLSEVRRVLESDGELRMIEHVRSTSALGARVQDFIQPAWTKVTGGCHNNRDTEANVRAAGFAIDADSCRAEGTMRRFVARTAR